MIGLNAFAHVAGLFGRLFEFAIHLAASSGGEFPGGFSRRLGQGRGHGFSLGRVSQR